MEPKQTDLQKVKKLLQAGHDLQLKDVSKRIVYTKIIQDHGDQDPMVEVLVDFGSQQVMFECAVQNFRVITWPTTSKNKRRMPVDDLLAESSI